MTEIIDVIIRSSLIYLFIVAAIRIFGKREISQLSVVDLVFILLISNSVQNAMVGPNTSLISGIIAAGTLFGINRILGILTYKFKLFQSALEGQAVMLVYQGKIIQKHLEQAEISRDELYAAIREHGVEHIENVDLAILEVDGNISVLSDNFHKKTTKKRKAHKVIERAG